MTVLSTPGGADGTFGRIFHNGVQVYSLHTHGDTLNNTLPLVLAVGDILDFAVDPDGAGNLAIGGINTINDGGDSTTFSIMISTSAVPFVPIPEPSTYAMAGLGLLIAAWAARRRGRGGVEGSRQRVEGS